MQKEEKRGGQKVRLVLLAGLLAVLGGGAFFVSQRITGIDLTGSKHRFEFPDGGGFHLFEVELTKTLYLDSSRPARHLARGNLRTSQYADGGWMNFQVDHVDETYLGRRLDLKSEGLVLVAGTTDRSGKKIVPSICRWAFWGEFAQAHYQDSGAARQPQETKATTLEYGVEIEDGKGGWNPMFGPYTTEEENWKTLLTAPVFPRDQANLKLRIQRDGSAPLVVSLPNPAFGTPAKTWKADPKPYRKSLDLGEIELVEVRWRWPRSGGRAELQPVLSVRPKGERKPKEFSARVAWMFDETGNEALDENFSVMNGVQRICLRGTVRPDMRHYRWHTDEVEFLAEGEWQVVADDLPMTLEKTAEEQGLASIVLMETGPTPGRLNFKFDWDLKSYRGNKTPEAPITYGGVLFLDEETVSTRASALGSGGIGFDGGELVQAYRILGMEAEPKAGQRMRMARIRDSGEESFEFVIPASEIPPRPLRRP